MIIGINGYIGSGKDTVAMMIQFIAYQNSRRWEPTDLSDFMTFHEQMKFHHSGWQVRKFAFKLKQMVSLLTGIPVEDLEKQEVKSRELGSEWNYHDYALCVGRPPEGRTGKRKYMTPDFYLQSSQEEREYHDMQPHAMTVRELLQKLGTDAVRDKVHPNAWVNALMADYQSTGHISKIENKPKVPVANIPIYPKWIISDCRFPNEGQAIKDRGGVIWRINRPEASQPDMDLLSKKLYPPKRHSSETSLDNWNFDRVIDNSGTLEELLSKVLTILKEDNLLTT